MDNCVEKTYKAESAILAIIKNTPPIKGFFQARKITRRRGASCSRCPSPLISPENVSPIVNRSKKQTGTRSIKSASLLIICFDMLLVLFHKRL